MRNYKHLILFTPLPMWKADLAKIQGQLLTGCLRTMSSWQTRPVNKIAAIERELQRRRAAKKQKRPRARSLYRQGLTALRNRAGRIDLRDTGVFYE